MGRVLKLGDHAQGHQILHRAGVPHRLGLGLGAQQLGQVGGELPFNDNLSLLPAVIVMGQGPSLTSIFGANFRYTNRDWREVAIRAGIWGQGSNQNNGFNFPSVIFTAILEMNRVNIGISYDVNAGQLAEPTNSRGAFELSLIYVHPASRRERVACPKF